MSWFLKYDADDASKKAFRRFLPGVSVSRRLVCGGVLGMTALLSSTSKLLGKDVAPSVRDDLADTLSLTDFERLLTEESKKLFAANFEGEEAYLDIVGALLKRLDTDDLPEAGITDDDLSGTLFGLGFEDKYIGGIVIAMEPGAAIPLHDHRNHNGVILGVSGFCDTQYFDLVESPEGYDVGAPVFLQRSDRVMIEAGAIGSLSRARNNVHELRAGREGCLMFDVFTYEREDAHSHPIRVTEGDVFGAGELVKGVWSDKFG